MLLKGQRPIHLTYCLNVHPGESWAENLAAIEDKTMRVRAAVRAGLAGHGSEGSPIAKYRDREPHIAGGFGLGLRLSNRAARELAEAEELKHFKDFLSANGLYVFTINGFPYGQFHHAAVKHEVYRPDWSQPERAEYTNLLADILAELLPEGVEGSISTVPVSYKGWLNDAGLEQACVNLAGVALHLHELRTRTGRDICLALEGEPDCLLETTDQAVAFLTGLFRHLGRQRLVSVAGMTRQQAQGVLEEHVGVCADTAHVAVEFEDPAESLRQFQAAGIRIAKIQLSAALRVPRPANSAGQLEAFCDPVYLHQTKVRNADGQVRSYADLPEALAQMASHECHGHGRAAHWQDAGAAFQEEWRVHFHVPLFFEQVGGLESTSRLLDESFWLLLRGGACPNLEIETYTFTVLPPALAVQDVCEGIAREYLWVLGKFGA